MPALAEAGTYTGVGAGKNGEGSIEVSVTLDDLPEMPPLYFDMTVLEYMKFAADLKKIPRNQKDKHRPEVGEPVLHAGAEVLLQELTILFWYCG